MVRIEPAPKASARSRLGGELPNLLYGFGDVATPDPATVELLEAMVTCFVEETARTAAAVSQPTRLRAEDVLFAVRRDPRKAQRGEELLLLYDAIQDARKKFNDPLAALEDEPASAAGAAGAAAATASGAGGPSSATGAPSAGGT